MPAWRRAKIACRCRDFMAVGTGHSGCAEKSPGAPGWTAATSASNPATADRPLQGRSQVNDHTGRGELSPMFIRPLRGPDASSRSQTGLEALAVDVACGSGWRTAYPGKERRRLRPMHPAHQ